MALLLITNTGIVRPEAQALIDMGKLSLVSVSSHLPTDHTHTREIKMPKPTITELKRRMKVGSIWSFKAAWCPKWTYRTVTHNQSNSVAFTSVNDPARSSWLDWPKKGDCLLSFTADGKMHAKLAAYNGEILHYMEV